MLTGLVSSISGFIFGSAPKLIKEFTDTRDHKRELELIKVQTDNQLKIAEVNGNVKVAEMDGQVEIAAYKATAEISTKSMRKTGVGWVDQWNGALRPFTVTFIILLYIGIASAYSYSVFSEVETIADLKHASALLWGSLIGESIQAVLGFLFGYRSARK